MLNELPEFLLLQTINSIPVFLFIVIVDYFFAKNRPFLSLLLWHILLLKIAIPINFINIWDSELINTIPSFMAPPFYPLTIVNSPAENIIPAQQFITITHLLLLIWAIIALSMFYLFLKQRYSILHHKENQLVTANHTIQQLVSDWQKKLNIRRKINVIITPIGHSPFTMGVLQPVIFIPRSLLPSADTDQMNIMIAHEMVHIRHFDALLVVFRWVISCCYFFNPIIWIAHKRLHLLSEIICDLTAIQQPKINPTNYGNALLTIYKPRSQLLNHINKQKIPASTLMMASAFQSLKQRIYYIKKENLMKRNKINSELIFAIIISCAILPAAIAGKNSTKLFNPLPDAWVSSKYGHRNMSTDNDKDQKHFHNGVDLVAPKGSKIHAISSGTINNIVYNHPGYGTYLTIMHDNGMISLYSSLDKVMVHKGDAVNANDIIATVGQSTLSTGPHLHFELKINEQNVNPLNYIEDAPRSSRKGSS